MLLISEIIIANPQIDDFEELVSVLKTISKASDERFFRMDVKPDYQNPLTTGRTALRRHFTNGKIPQ